MLTSSIATGEESRAFLQRRVARFGLVASLLFWGFLAFRVVLATLTNNHEAFDASMVCHLLAGACFCAVWLVSRRGHMSVLAIRVTETVGIIVGSFFTEVMGLYIDLTANPPLLVAHALTFGLVCRAIFVPSSGRRSALLAISVGVPLIGLTYYQNLQLDLERWGALYPDIRSGQLSVHDIALTSALFAAAWWTLTVVSTTLASVVIYGLRRQVEDIRQLGQYHLEEKLGEGGMGMVYRARHAMLRRATAIKLLPVEKSSERAVERFEREVQLTAKLSHPNTVRIYDYGRTNDGVFYYAMELVDGATLSEVVEVSGAQTAGRVIDILHQAASALVEAHGVGLIHRDIKPANIMVFLMHDQGGITDTVKVLDFGLVKEADVNTASSVTQGDVITGTPMYMSPESITTPEAIDARSDLYALGAVGYFLVTGTHLFTGKTVIEVCSRHLGEEPEPPSKRLGAPVPAELEKVLLACLAKRPEDRPASALELCHALEGCRRPGDWTASDAANWWEETREAIVLARDAPRARHRGSLSQGTIGIRLARGRLSGENERAGRAPSV